MPKLVTKKIKKIIKTFSPLKGKIIQIHCKNYGFEGSAGWARKWKRYQQNNQKWKPNPFQNR